MELLKYNEFVSEKLNIQPIDKNELTSDCSDVSLDLLERVKNKMHGLIHQFDQRADTYEERCNSNVNTAEYDENCKRNLLKIMYCTFGKTDPNTLAEKIFKFLSLNLGEYEKIKHNIIVKIYTDSPKSMMSVDEWNNYVVKTIRGNDIVYCINKPKN